MGRRMRWRPGLSWPVLAEPSRTVLAIRAVQYKAVRAGRALKGNPSPLLPSPRHPSLLFPRPRNKLQRNDLTSCQSQSTLNSMYRQFPTAGELLPGTVFLAVAWRGAAQCAWVGRACPALPSPFALLHGSGPFQQAYYVT